LGRRTLFSLLACVVLLAVLPEVASAARPANDDFAAAQPLVGETASADGSNVDATKETGEPNHARRPGGRSIWYRWTAPYSGTVVIDTKGSKTSLLLAAYTGASVDGLTEVASNEYWDGSPQSRVRLKAVEGRTYMVAVDDNWKPGAVRVNVSLGPAPPNDDFASAFPLEGPAASATSDTTRATREAGEPGQGSIGGASVWFTWKAPSTGAVLLSSQGSAVGANTSVYTGGSVDRLRSVTYAYSQSKPRAVFRAEEGVTYRIAVEPYSDHYLGEVRLALSMRAVPENDALADATSLEPAAHVLVSGRSDGASAESGEPLIANYGPRATVWYSWTAPSTGSLTYKATADDFPPIVAAYTGDTPGELVAVPSQTESAGAPQDRIRVEAGTTYKIAVANYDAYIQDGGDFKLELTLAARPANDDFSAATELHGTDVDVRGTTENATWEPGEPVHGMSVWYTWTAPVTGGVTIDEAYDNRLNVYTGDSVGALASVSPKAYQPESEEVRFRAVAGVTYRIAVMAYHSTRVILKLAPPPANDMFAAAAPLVPLDGTVTAAGSNNGATGEPGEPNPGGTAAATVWYSYTPTASGAAALHLSNLDGIFPSTAVYTGSAVGGLQRVTEGNYDVPRFRVVAGTTYYVAVYGRDPQGSLGDFTLRLSFTPTPPNDQLADAVELPGASAERTGSNLNGTREPGEPSINGSTTSGSSVWYSWTAPATGRARVGVTGSGFSAVFAVFTGNEASRLSRVLPPRSAPDSFPVVAGTTYRIAVDGSSPGSGGSFTLKLESFQAPPNDAFADAKVLTGLVDDAHTSNLGATTEPADPSRVAGYDSNATVWYRWRAPASGPVAVDSGGSDCSTVLGVYTGTSSRDRVSVGEARGYRSDAGRVAFQASEGTEYRIVMDGAGRTYGDLSVNVHLDAPAGQAAPAEEPAPSSEPPAQSGSQAGAPPPAAEPPAAEPPVAEEPPALEEPAAEESPAADPSPREPPQLGDPVPSDPPGADPATSHPVAEDPPPAPDPPAGGPAVVDPPPAGEPSVTVPPAGESSSASEPPAGEPSVTVPPAGESSSASEPPAEEPSVTEPPAPDPPAGDPGPASPEQGSAEAPATDPQPSNEHPASGPTASDTPSAGQPSATGSPAQLALSRLRLSAAFPTQRLGVVLKRGLIASATCSNACSVSGSIELDAGTATRAGLARRISAASGSAAAHGSQARLTLRLTRPAARKLGRLRSVRVTVRLVARDGDHTATTSRRLTLKR
jgi:hypothetical protein